ncbi:base plate protein gp25 of Bacteriophage [Enterobacter sp. FY-07]|uniref:GPW/gp25 family protein n=1 Tax=Kosakonia oryzendophytica TaxID=1005665 RepID=UPI000777F087|nr:GPW/gp25 family protein [Kosakonia oryzendophytica]AMO46505.1 base plate protein gp25 of Bacteriophage [Enterobacter sp. FY-07]WBT58299.1 GPW/gp25 family protein [Kosakonia oryzendophytica]
MSSDKYAASLGRSWAFPPQFSVAEGVKMAEGVDSVLQSLLVLFMTEPGERIMRETYGGGLNEFLFENITDELLASIRNHIEDAVLVNEQRTEVKEILIKQATNDVSRLLVQITLKLLGSDITETLSGTLAVNEGYALRLL